MHVPGRGRWRFAVCCLLVVGLGGFGCRPDADARTTFCGRVRAYQDALKDAAMTPSASVEGEGRLRRAREHVLQAQRIAPGRRIRGELGVVAAFLDSGLRGEALSDEDYERFVDAEHDVLRSCGLLGATRASGRRGGRTLDAPILCGSDGEGPGGIVGAVTYEVAIRTGSRSEVEETAGRVVRIVLDWRLKSGADLTATLSCGGVGTLFLHMDRELPPGVLGEVASMSGVEGIRRA